MVASEFKPMASFAGQPMTLLPKRTFASLALILSLILILAVLATLQYRWSGQISESVRERMQASLETSMYQFRQQYSSELRQLAMSFQPDAAIQMQKNWKSYAANCSVVLSGAEGDLVHDVFLWVAMDDGKSRLLHLNQQLNDFEPIDWPSNLASVKERYASAFLNTSSRPVFDALGFGWTMFSRTPILLRLLLDNRPPFAVPSSGPGNDFGFSGFLMIELDAKKMQSMMMPEIARRTFWDPDGFIYHVAVVDEFSQAFIYRSDSDLTLAAFAESDAKISLLENHRDRPNWGPPDMGRRPSGPRSFGPPPSTIPPFFRQPGRDMGPLSVEEDGEGWTLVAKHREGSLETAVAGMRRRNLAISFGGLLLLAASMALIISAARRQQRLARLQLDFVAGISHELRTPLAVICSAGDNLAEGIIADSSPSTRKYGELVRTEGRKLDRMIERILQFAGLQRGPQPYTLRSVQINEIAVSALKEAETALASAGFSVEKNLTPGLPSIHVEPDALLQAIQNLIQNALKYSGESRWLAIRTEEAAGKRASEVRLVIEDRGMGIDKEDLPHIFEPFYRGKMALSEQIHGAGLGLYMVCEMLASMGAKIRVKSEPGQGSKFTICFSATPLPGQDGIRIENGI
jgi:two-component system, OmpR family, sensor histidine kinase SenX3